MARKLFLIVLFFTFANVSDAHANERNHGAKILPSPIAVPFNEAVYDINGKQYQLANFIGSDYTLLLFWATWCGYCKKEIPEMDSMIPEMSKRGIKVVPIVEAGSDKDAVIKFFNNNNIRNTGSLVASSSELPRSLGIDGYPSFIMVKNGKAYAKIRPNWRASDLFTFLNNVMQESKKF